MTAAVHLLPVGERPPASLEAEQALLGAVLYQNRAFSLVAGIADVHFSEPFHGRLWTAVAEVIGRGGIAEPVSMAERFAADPAFGDMGGLGYLAALVNHAPGPEMASTFAQTVRDCAMRRDLARICADGMKAAFSDRERAAFEVASEIRAEIDRIETESAPEDSTLIEAPIIARRAIDGMREMAASGKPRGMMTGLRCIDRRMNGIKRGALIVIGGRPGMCKTGLARAMAHGAAVRNPGQRFLFLNLEMEGVEIMQRELAAITHEMDQAIPYRTMESGALTPMDFMVIDDAEKRVPSNLILDDRCANLSVEDVRRKVWALQRKGPVGAVFIDYLQLMRRPAFNGRNEASVIAEMTSGLKALAREGKVGVVLLSQLNRGVEGRDDKKPQLSDLKESGSIEADADAVLFPFREFYYLVKAEPRKTERDKHLEWEMRCADTVRRLEVICAKQRGGPEGVDEQRYFAEVDYIEDVPQ